MHDFIQMLGVLVGPLLQNAQQCIAVILQKQLFVRAGKALVEVHLFLPGFQQAITVFVNQLLQFLTVLYYINILLALANVKFLKYLYREFQ